jgi:hypothetical protein
MLSIITHRCLKIILILQIFMAGTTNAKENFGSKCLNLKDERLRRQACNNRAKEEVAAGRKAGANYWIDQAFRNKPEKLYQSKATNKTTSAWLGVIFSRYGKPDLKVDGVISNSAAEKAGIVRGDFLTSVNGRKVTRRANFTNQIRMVGIGKTAKIGILRYGKVKVVNATLTGPPNYLRTGFYKPTGGESKGRKRIFQNLANQKVPVSLKNARIAWQLRDSPLRVSFNSRDRESICYVPQQNCFVNWLNENGNLIAQKMAPKETGCRIKEYLDPKTNLYVLRLDAPLVSFELSFQDFVEKTEKVFTDISGKVSLKFGRCGRGSLVAAGLRKGKVIGYKSVLMSLKQQGRLTPHLAEQIKSLPIGQRNLIAVSHLKGPRDTKQSTLEALEFLSQISVSDEKLIQFIKSKLGNPHETIRQWALRAMEKQSNNVTRKSYQALIDSGSNPDPNYRYSIGRSLAKVDEPWALDMVILNLKMHKNTYVRKSMVQAMNRFWRKKKDPKILAALIDAVGDKNQYIRAEAVQYLVMLTRVNLGTNHGKWKQWWADNKNYYSNTKKPQKKLSTGKTMNLAQLKPHIGYLRYEAENIPFIYRKAHRLPLKENLKMYGRRQDGMIYMGENPLCLDKRMDSTNSLEDLCMRYMVELPNKRGKNWLPIYEKMKLGSRNWYRIKIKFLDGWTTDTSNLQVLLK